MKHLLDYKRDKYTSMTKCNKIVGNEHISERTEPQPYLPEEELCSTCSTVAYRLDEPEECQPGAEGSAVTKEERYGD